MKAALLLWCLAVTVCLSGCGGVKTAPDPLQQWQGLSLENYDYEIKRDLFSTPQYTRAMRVNVRSGAVQSARYLDDSTAVPAEVLRSLRTVNGWFAYIDKGRQKPFFRLDVRYHDTLGYPTYLYVDIRERVADDEQTVRIENLSPR